MGGRGRASGSLGTVSRICVCVCAEQKRSFSLGEKTSLSHCREASPPHGLQRGNLGAVSCPHRLLLGGCLGLCPWGCTVRGQALTAGALCTPPRPACPAHLLIALFPFSSHLITPVPSWAAGSPWATAWGELAQAPRSPPRVLPVRQSRVWKENRLPTWNSTLLPVAPLYAQSWPTL